MLRVFDPDQAVLRCQYPVKIGNVQTVVENDEAFRSRLQKKISAISPRGQNVSWRVVSCRGECVKASGSIN